MATANNEFFEALSALEKERGLPEDYLIDKIKAAIVIAVKKDYEVEDDNVVVDIDPELGAFRASLLRDIVEEVENPHTQVSLEDAQKVRKSYKVGQRMVTPLKTKEFGRIAAQTAKHVIRQGLREGERNLQCSEMQSRAHELIAATVVNLIGIKTAASVQNVMVACLLLSLLLFLFLIYALFHQERRCCLCI